VSAADAGLRVCVVYALAQFQRLVNVELPPGSTLMNAVEASGLLQDFPEILHNPLRLGVFGRERALDEQLQNGDRVEIYRPLQADPKEARRQRAERRPLRRKTITRRQNPSA